MGKVYLNDRAALLIRGCLRQKNITQEIFADSYLKTTFRTFQNWLSGKTPMPVDKLDVIQKYCCFSIKYLFGDVPSEYISNVGGLGSLLKRMLNVDFLLAIRDYYQSYVDWVLKCVHFNPYPIRAVFDILDHDTEKNGKNYYCNLEICLDSNEVPVGETFVIGYVLLTGRIRVDYGWMKIKENFIEVGEAFTQNSVEYRLPIDKDAFNETGVLFQIITWLGEESCTFVVHSSVTQFKINNLGAVDKKESDILLMKANTSVVFMKGAHHNLKM